MSDRRSDGMDDRFIEAGLRGLLGSGYGPPPSPELREAIIEASARAVVVPLGAARRRRRVVAAAMSAAAAVAAVALAATMVLTTDGAGPGSGPVAGSPPTTSATTTSDATGSSTEATGSSVATTSPTTTPGASSSTTLASTTTAPPATTTTVPPTTTTVPSTTTTVPPTTTTTVPPTTTTTVPPTTTTTVPPTTTTTTVPAGTEVCDGEWSADHDPSEANADGIVVVRGVVIDFYTATEIRQEGGALFGIGWISDPGVVVWVAQAHAYGSVSATAVPWYTDSTRAGVLSPILRFDVCLPAGEGSAGRSARMVGAVAAAWMLHAG